MPESQRHAYSPNYPPLRDHISKTNSVSPESRIMAQRSTTVRSDTAPYLFVCCRRRDRERLAICKVDESLCLQNLEMRTSCGTGVAYVSPHQRQYIVIDKMAAAISGMPESPIRHTHALLTSAGTSDQMDCPFLLSVPAPRSCS